MEKDLKRAKELANLFENRFKFFNMSFGLDPLLGLVPGVGDTIASFLSLYLVGIALKWQIPRFAISRMIFNVGIDYVIGLIPFIGNIGDFAFKSNTRNLKILEANLLKKTKMA